MVAKSKINKYFALPIFFCSVSQMALAFDTDIKGLLSAEYHQSNTEALYNENIDKDGDAKVTLLLNISAKVNDQWSVASQLWNGDGEVEVDWAFATYQHSDAISLKVGLQKYPLGLITPYYDVGTAYPWVRPPIEFYQAELGFESPNIVMESFEGISLSYHWGEEFDIHINPFIGEANGEEADVKDLLGLMFEISNDIARFHAGYSQSKLIQTEGEEPLLEDKRSEINAGLQVNYANWLLYAEYGENTFDDLTELDSEAFYVTMGYEFGDFTPALTFSDLKAHEGSLDQTTTAISLAYWLAPKVRMKLQAENVKPDNPEEEGLVEELPESEEDFNVYTVKIDILF